MIDYYNHVKGKVENCPVCGSKPTIQPDYGPLYHIYCNVYACDFSLMVTGEGLQFTVKSWNKTVKKYRKGKLVNKWQ